MACVLSSLLQGLGEKRKESFKICTSHICVSRGLGKRQGFGIIDKLVIRWELGFDVSVFSLSLLSFASRPRCVSFFLLDSYNRMPKNSVSLRTGQLFIVIIWSIFLLLSSSTLLLFSFLPCLPHYLQYGWKISEKKMLLNFYSDGHFDKTLSSFFNYLTF